MIYTGGVLWFNFFGLRGDLFPVIFSNLLVLLTITASGYIFNKHFLKLLVALICLSFPVLRFGMGTPHMDIPVAYFILVSIMSMFYYLKTKKMHVMVLTVILCTASFCCKHFAALYLLPVIALFSFCFIKKKGAQAKIF